jgi:hypothetical protein
MYRRSMLAFRLVPLLPIYHLVNRQTSGRTKWAHGRKPEASSYPSLAIRRQASSISASIFA